MKLSLQLSLVSIQKLMTHGPTRTSNTALHVDSYSGLFRKKPDQTRWTPCRRVYGAPVFESSSNTAPFIFQRPYMNNAQKPVKRNLMMPFWLGLPLRSDTSPFPSHLRPHQLLGILICSDISCNDVYSVMK